MPRRALGLKRPAARDTRTAMGDERSAGEPSFEAILDRLGQVAKELEKSDVPLEKALALFEEGVGLVRGAEERLQKAESRLEELTGKARANDEPPKKR
jgi:exodeoxyribonuclease VII small subunit